MPCFSLLCSMCTACLGLFALPLGIFGIFGRLCSVIVALPGRLLYNFANPRSRPLELFSENIRIASRFGYVNCWLQKLSLFAN